MSNVYNPCEKCFSLGINLLNTPPVCINEENQIIEQSMDVSPESCKGTYIVTFGTNKLRPEKEIVEFVSLNV